MRIDEPSSSSPADGDARFAELRPPVSHRTSATNGASVAALSDRGSAAASPHTAAQAWTGGPAARPEHGSAGTAAHAERVFAGGPVARGEQALAGGPTAHGEQAPAGGPTAHGERAPAAGPWPRAELAPVADPAPRDPRLIETAGAPAPEALRGMAVAAAVVRELYESGREVRFAFAPAGERVAVLLCDVDGTVLSRLTPARALEIATGEPAPGGRRR